MRQRHTDFIVSTTFTAITTVQFTTVVDTLAHDEAILWLDMGAVTGFPPISMQGSPDGINFGDLYSSSGYTQIAYASPGLSEMTTFYEPLPRFIRAKVDPLGNPLTGTISFALYKGSLPA